jgi:hypothetical protein
MVRTPPVNPLFLRLSTDRYPCTLLNQWQVSPLQAGIREPSREFERILRRRPLNITFPPAPEQKGIRRRYRGHSQPNVPAVIAA